MDYSREKLVEIWQRAAPGTPTPELFDSLVYPDSGGEGPGGARSVPAEEDGAWTESGQPSAETDRLRSIAAGENCLCQLYDRLYRVTRRREFRRLAAESMAGAKSAAGLCYLFGGELASHRHEPPGFADVYEGMRLAWTLERSIADACTHLDRGLLGGIDGMCDRHAGQLRSMLERSL